jgi:hypothetical protein
MTLEEMGEVLSMGLVAVVLVAGQNLTSTEA